MSRYDIEYDVEGNTFIRMNLTGEQVQTDLAELRADPNVSNVEVVDWCAAEQATGDGRARS